jgi:hypothetical protein
MPRRLTEPHSGKLGQNVPKKPMPHPINCGDCERRPRTHSGRCYYDMLKRKTVKKSSEACDNHKPKEPYNGL